MSDSFFKELFEKYENNTDTFVFDATNIDGIYKYLKTVTQQKKKIGHFFFVKFTN